MNAFERARLMTRARYGKPFNLWKEAQKRNVGTKARLLRALQRSNPVATEETWADIATVLGVEKEDITDPARELPPFARDYLERWRAEEAAHPEEEPPPPADPNDGLFAVVPPGDLTYAEEDFAANEYVLLPTWEGTIAGFKDEWHFDDGKLAPPTEVPKYMLSRKHKGRFIVCKPKGYSMAPRIQQGDVVLVRLESNPAPGDIIIARNEGTGQNYIKVFRVVGRPGDEIPELHSINGNFPIIGMDEDWVCRGVVVGIRKPYVAEGLNEEFRNGSPLRA